MQKEKCSCDGLMLTSLLVGVALGAVIMVAIGAMLTYDPNGTPIFFGAEWWEVMTALGTTGAALAAVLYPIRQNKEMQKNRLLDEFVLSEITSRAVGLLKTTVDDYIRMEQPPNMRTLEHLITQLELAHQVFVSPDGKLAISEALNLSLDAHVVMVKLPEAITIKNNQGDFTTNAPSRLARSEARLINWKTRAEALKSQVNKWQSNLLTKLDNLGARPAVVRYGEGKASIQTSAIGDASVKHPSSHS